MNMVIGLESSTCLTFLQTKDYQIDICCFSAKYAALKCKNKEWLAQNQDNVSEWDDMSTRGLYSFSDLTQQFQLSVLV